MCWNIVTNLLVCLFDELRAVRVVDEDAFNHPDTSKNSTCGVYFRLIGLWKSL